METQNVEKVLRENLSYHEKEVKRLSAMIALCNGHFKPERTKRAYTKRRVKGSAPTKKVGVLHWEKPLRSLFTKNNNTPLTCKEIVNTLFPDRYSSTKKLMRARLSSILLKYESRGWVRAHRDAHGKGFIKYNLK